MNVCFRISYTKYDFEPLAKRQNIAFYAFKEEMDGNRTSVNL